MSDCRSVQSVAELMGGKMIISSANKKYLECLKLAKVSNKSIK
jgi:hypothetical protein